MLPCARLHSYPDSVQYLYSLGNEIRTLKFGLDGITTLLDALGRPDRSFRSVHVAGTNGKGSTAAMIESGLRAAGLRTGLYTSPHLIEPTERIQIRGQQATPEQFAGAFETVHSAAKKLLTQGAIGNHPTYFETVTAMAFLLLQQARVDVAVLEVGMGGRLDATNVVTPELAVITPIDFDHERWLGNTIESIAAEKAGILKPGIPAIFARQRPEAAKVLQSEATRLSCPVTQAAEIAAGNLTLDAYGSSFQAMGLNITCPLAGVHQVDNALTALAALKELRISANAIERGIAATRWPGRLEVVRRNPDVLLDGAHNPAGARALAEYMRRFHSGNRVSLIYAAMRDKSVQEVMEVLFPLAHEVVVTALCSARALDPQAIAGLADHPRVRTAASVPEALNTAVRETGDPDVILVTGSLHLVGEARALLVQ